MLYHGYLGPVTLGDTIRLGITAINGSLVATTADSAPSWSIYLFNGGDDSEILTGNLGAAAADSKTGYHTGNAAITVGNGFAAGNVYRIRYSTTISAAEIPHEAYFRVI